MKKLFDIELSEEEEICEETLHELGCGCPDCIVEPEKEGDV